MTPTVTLSEKQIRKRVRELGSWFHNLDLRGVRTAPAHFLGDYPNVKWRRFASAIPKDLKGASVLDIGCNAGFYSMEMKRRGAGRVVAIDSDQTYLEQARFAFEVCDMDIELREMSVYEVADLKERFDWVLFMGVFYHLRHPLLALDLLCEHVASDWLVFQSMLRGTSRVDALDEDYPFEEKEIFESPGFPKMYFIEQNYAHDPTNWWIPNRACIEAMLRSAGFEIVNRPEKETYICRKRS